MHLGKQETKCLPSWLGGRPPLSWPELGPELGTFVFTDLFFLLGECFNAATGQV